MGVPAFFRWLSRKYPSVIIECVENKQVDPDTGKNIYDDATLPNPNGVEFDNLYLDMNGIIHPCTHQKIKPAPKNEDEMMIAIFRCIDRLMNIVKATQNTIWQLMVWHQEQDEPTAFSSF
ncbi:5'-3' exoribonuclease 2 homolog [Eumeta japonica]|uniref:5'-3' exoribonuclease 2 homolog n=1 Tax=Eumeta variegata TaxID=151549 RepID=A0A4C1TTD8_EUMVA|nr:5'-3' exoribonuclease 2 homolog [Eumeta japonica]